MLSARLMGMTGTYIVPGMKIIWTGVFLFVILISFGESAKEESNDIHSYLEDLNEKESNSNDQTISGVRRLWGVPDTTAFVGRIFSYTIPDDAFSGKIERYVITEAGEPSLPNWIYFEEDSNTFRGVPTEQDIGHVYISIKAVAKTVEDDPSVAKDVFSIDVMDDSYMTDRERKKCPSQSTRTIMTVIADANMADLPPYRRYDLVTKMASEIGLNDHDVKLVTLGGDQAYDDQALVAGPGNTHVRDGAGVTFKWIVGCEGVINDTETVTLVQKFAKDGKLANQLGLPVIGWHVTNQQPIVLTRLKRQNHIYGTPVPAIIPTLWTSEAVDDVEPSEDTIIPESRVVPTMSSPIYTMPSHHHRHHHVASNRGHHRHHITPSSPVFMLHSTPVLASALPTMHIESSMFFPKETIRPSVATFSVVMPDILTSPTPAMTGDVIQPTRSYQPVEPSQQPDLNFKPTVSNRLKKLTMIAGKIWRYQIPRDTFTDMEDGDTRNLKLMFLTSEGASIPMNSWIQFDIESQSIYALPLEDHVGVHYFILEAMDSEEKSTSDTINLRVWPHPDRVLSHYFKIVVSYQTWQYVIGIDWQIEVLKRIAHLYGDSSESAIVVKSITLDPATITWYNDTISVEKCEREIIAELYKKLAEPNDISKKLKTIMRPEFHVKDIEVDYAGICDSSYRPTSIIPPTTYFSPIIRNPIDQINITVGDVLQFIIPEDTFYDVEDGGTKYLKLSFLTVDNVKPDKSSWIQFDERLQTIQGLPGDHQIGKHEFQMIAYDNNNNHVTDVFIIHVKARKSEKASVEFSVHLDEDFDQFNKDITKKLLVARKIARIYNDYDARYMRIISISPGSVMFSWTNNTLPTERCPKHRIQQLVKKLATDDGKPSNKLIRALHPEFKILKVVIMPLGHCLTEIPGISTVPPITTDFTKKHATKTTESITKVTSKHVTKTTTESITQPLTESSTESTTELIAIAPTKPATSTSDDDIYITTVIPAVVIAIMLIIAAMVACFLYRKKRKGKMTMQDTSGFMSKGVPIIFADEIEEKPDPAKPPVIMKDEKPPLSQPTYQTTGSTEPTPQMERREPQSDPPYQPPPPFTASREAKNGRPKATPTYRQPPPYYVPP